MAPHSDDSAEFASTGTSRSDIHRAEPGHRSGTSSPRRWSTNPTPSRPRLVGEPSRSRPRHHHGVVIVHPPSPPVFHQQHILVRLPARRASPTARQALQVVQTLRATAKVARQHMPPQPPSTHRRDDREGNRPEARKGHRVIHLCRPKSISTNRNEHHEDRINRDMPREPNQQRRPNRPPRSIRPLLLVPPPFEAQHGFQLVVRAHPATSGFTGSIASGRSIAEHLD